MNSLLDEMIADERRQDFIRVSVHEQRVKDAQRAATAPKTPNRLLAFAINALASLGG